VSLASALRLYIANYFRSSAPRYGLVDPASRLAFRIERPRRSRKGSKKTAVEIKPPVQDGINNPVVVRQDSNVQVISGKFLGYPVGCVSWRGIKTCEHHSPSCGRGSALRAGPVVLWFSLGSRRS